MVIAACPGYARGVVLERRGVLEKHVGHRERPADRLVGSTDVRALIRRSRVCGAVAGPGGSSVSTTRHVVRRPTGIRQNTTIAHRTAMHTLSRHPLRNPQLIAPRTPAVPMARGMGDRCDMGHDSTSLRRLRGLRRPAPRVSWPTPKADGRHDLTLTMMNTGPACRYRNSLHTARGRPLSSNPTMTFARVPRRQSGGFRRPIIRTAARRSPAGLPTSTLEPGMPVLLDGPSRDCKDCSPAGA